MANQVAKVVREKIVECITCPLCKKLFREATTISECLHTFCRKCIYDKISYEELDRCPICDIYMRCVPLEKLRPDHNLQDLRAKIFPFRKRKVKTPEVSVALQVKRKERSLSSLVVSTPKVATTATTTGRRTTAAERIAAICEPKIDTHVVKEEDSVEDHLESSSSLDRPAKIVHTKRNVEEANMQSSSLAEPSQQIRNKGAENGAEPLEGKLDLWKLLNCLVEVENRTKSFKSNTQKVNTKVEHSQIADREDHVVKCKTKEGKRKSKGEDVKKNHDPASSEIERPKKLQRVCRKREPASPITLTSPSSTHLPLVPLSPPAASITFSVPAPLPSIDLPPVHATVSSPIVTAIAQISSPAVYRRRASISEEQFSSLSAGIASLGTAHASLESKISSRLDVMETALSTLASQFTQVQMEVQKIKTELRKEHDILQGVLEKRIENVQNTIQHFIQISRIDAESSNALPQFSLLRPTTPFPEDLVPPVSRPESKFTPDDNNGLLTVTLTDPMEIEAQIVPLKRNESVSMDIVPYQAPSHLIRAEPPVFTSSTEHPPCMEMVLYQAPSETLFAVPASSYSVPYLVEPMEENTDDMQWTVCPLALIYGRYLWNLRKACLNRRYSGGLIG